MSTGHAFNRRDKSEPRYVAIWRSHGATWIPLPRGCGCDGFLLCNSEIAIVENKSSERAELTDDERKLQQKCILAGVAYNVIDSELAALNLVNDMQDVHLVDLSELERIPA